MTPKNALITGSARRIGAEIARILHENGMNVVLHYHHSKKEANRLCNELNQLRENSAASLSADLTDISELKQLIQQAVDCFGRLDVLVNNASCFFKTLPGNVTEKAFDQLITTNLKAPFFLAQAAFPHLAKNKGCLINITDIHAYRPLRDYTVYCMSKAGLAMLTKALAREWGPDVRVNAVSPGSIIWPEGENSLNDEIKQSIIHESALQSHGSPQEIAKTVLFLVRDALFVTGQDIAVDGGRI
jgi:pteridine reductase